MKPINEKQERCDELLCATMIRISRDGFDTFVNDFRELLEGTTSEGVEKLFLAAKEAHQHRIDHDLP